MRNESPTDLNRVYRLLGATKNAGPEFLYDPERMAQVLGRHSAACFDDPIFDEVCRRVENSFDERPVAASAQRDPE